MRGRGWCLESVRLDNLQMANREHVEILEQEIIVWNRWRAKNPNVAPDLQGAYLSRAYLSRANLSRADLSWADLQGADLSWANLSRADLSGANLSAAKLMEADLSKANLSGANLSGAALYSANLMEADLSRANLSRAYLSKANLSGAVLYWANLIEADLSWANLSRAYLSRADLSKATLSVANLTDASIGYLVFGDNDLSVVKGLETVKHGGPSSIGIDTVYRSHGKIPESFLRGAGVPDNFITYMRSLTGEASEFYSCFISYSSEDKQFCDRLYADLRAKGVRTWIFHEDAKWGKTVWGEIDRSIRIYDKLVVVCSEHSLQSGPVLREIERALIREDKEGKSVLFPIRIDDYIFDGWEHERKADVVKKVVGDFRDWDANAEKYNDAVQKLLRALLALA